MNSVTHNLIPCDVIHQRGTAAISAAIRDVCNSWGSHDAPVFERGGALFVLQIEPPKAFAVPLGQYLDDLRAKRVRWVALRMFQADHANPFLAEEVAQWKRNASKFWSDMDGRAYSRTEITRILVRHAIDILPLPDFIAARIKPRKGTVYCTRGCMLGLASPPLGSAGAPKGLAYKQFVNPGDMEVAMVYGNSLTVVGASDERAVPEIEAIQKSNL